MDRHARKTQQQPIVGIQFSHALSRPEFDARLVRREIEIIQSDLHGNAIRISGTYPERLAITARIALEQGLEVWRSAHLHDKTADETLAYTLDCARAAERLRQRHPEFVFIVGCELTVFMHGILPGADF